MLHVLAKRSWAEYGLHSWDKYETLCRTSVQLAKTFPKEKGLDLRNGLGLTPLMSAASTGNETMAFELVKAKADVNAVHEVRGKPDRTAMGMAACCKRSDIMDVLHRAHGYGLCEKPAKGDGYQKKSRQR